MFIELLFTAFVMGIVGGPHCLAMCGAACAGIGQLGSDTVTKIAFNQARKNHHLMLFHFGRVLGYSVIGGIAAASVQALGWLTIHSSALRPVWSMLHLAAIGLGLMLLVYARQPAWLDFGAKTLWSRFKANSMSKHSLTPLALGLGWSLMPCGLLYSALMVAALTGQVLQGTLIMSVFAIGTSISLWVGPWLWFKLKEFTGQGQWGIRLAGFALATTSAWGLWMGLVHNAAPWCVTPI